MMIEARCEALDTNRLFSVIIAHYGAHPHWKQAVDSVLQQNYPQVEIVFWDDATPKFDIFCVRKYIEEKKGSNIVAHIEKRSSVNRGTVQSLREAHTLCTGKYLIQIASDDCLANGDVLLQFSKLLDRKTTDIAGIYAKSIVCDRELVSTGECSFHTALAQKMNKMDAEKQFYVLCRGCCIHMGATAFLRCELLLSGDFDLQYKLIEDWPYFLRMTKAGKRFLFADFNALNYRKGGITSNDENMVLKKICYIDHLRIYENQILPAIKGLKTKERIKIYFRYCWDRETISGAVGSITSGAIDDLISYQTACNFVRIYQGVNKYWKAALLWTGGTLLIIAMGKKSLIALLCWTVLVVMLKRHGTHQIKSTKEGHGNG